MKLFYEKDIDKKLIDSKKVAVLGYGSQGHAHARNLKDSGMDVVVGLYEGSKSKEVAENDGLKVLSNSEAVKQSDVIMFCLPDTVQGKVYKQDVEENLSEGKTLIDNFFNIGLPSKDLLMSLTSNIGLSFLNFNLVLVYLKILTLIYIEVYLIYLIV